MDNGQMIEICAMKYIELENSKITVEYSYLCTHSYIMTFFW